MPTRPPVLRPSHLPSPQQQRTDYERERGSASARGYGRRWQKLRALVLSRQPLCVMCAADGRTTEATVVDHVIPFKGDERLLYDMSNLQPLCHSHHARKTNTDGSIGTGIGRLRR